MIRRVMSLLLLASLWTACATKSGQEPAPVNTVTTHTPAEDETSATETPALEIIEIKEENLRFKSDAGRDEAVARLDKAIATHAAGPQALNTLRMVSLAELTQRHIVEVIIEDAVLRVHVYPVEEANWELNFTVDEQDRLVALVTWTIKPPPRFDE